VGRVRKNSIDNDRVDLSSLDGSPERVPSRKRSITTGDKHLFSFHCLYIDINLCTNFICEGISNLVGRVRKNSTGNDRVDLSSLDGSPERVPSKKRLSITGGDKKLCYVYINLCSNV
jgi:hypothetical protein